MLYLSGKVEAQDEGSSRLAFWMKWKVMIYSKLNCCVLSPEFSITFMIILFLSAHHLLYLIWFANNICGIFLCNASTKEFYGILWDFMGKFKIVTRILWISGYIVVMEHWKHLNYCWVYNLNILIGWNFLRVYYPCGIIINNVNA